MEYRRRNNHMSQETLAVAAGVTRVTLSKIERGDPKVQQRTLEAVMRAAGLADWIETPGAALSDDELFAELERRRPGSVRWTAHGDTEPPGPRRGDQGVTHQGDKDEAAS